MAITLNGTTITLNDASTLVSTTTLDAIGSYSVLASISAVSRGSTIAGTSLLKEVDNNYGDSASQTGAGTTVSGTWRNMSNTTSAARSIGSEGVPFNRPALFCRTA
jgi:hypothetical protein